MSVKYYNTVIQGSDEWHKLRLGIVTASEVNKLLTPKGKPAKNATMRGYAAEIAAQRITKRVDESYQSWDMARGHIQEDIAREIYSDNYNSVDECGFITTDSFDGLIIGCSPDGLVGLDGGIEIKSRLARFQIQTIVADEVPDEYMNQIQMFLLVSGRAWCDFVQYSNGMPFYVKRVEIDNERQVRILLGIREFEAYVLELIAEYEQKSADLIKAEWVDICPDDEIEGVI